jgi:hypothetical protein
MISDSRGQPEADGPSLKQPGGHFEIGTHRPRHAPTRHCLDGQLVVAFLTPDRLGLACRRLPRAVHCPRRH